VSSFTVIGELCLQQVALNGPINANYKKTHTIKASPSSKPFNADHRPLGKGRVF